MRIAPLLFALSFSISACTAHQPPVTSSAANARTTEKTVQKHHLNLAEMQPQFLYLAAQDALENAQPALAIELLSALIKKDPEALKPHLQLTELLLLARQFDQAKQHINSLLQGNAVTPEQREHLQLALLRLYTAQGKNDTALAGIKLFLNTHPSNLAARNLQAKLLANMNRYDDALAALKKGIKQKDLPDFRLLQAQLLIKKRDFINAAIALKRMQQLLPDHDTPILMLSALALRENKHDKAESLLRDFLNKHPKAFRIANALGQLLVKDQRLVEAILIYRDAAERSNNNPVILHALGMLYFRHQDYGQAEAVFRQLVAIKPDDSSRFYLAASLEALNRMPEARKLYQTLGSSSLATEAQLRLASIDVINNDIDQAEQRLKNILQQEPMHLDALLMLSTIRLNQNKYQLLLDETEAIFALPQSPPQLLFNRAIAFESLKQYDQVEIMLNRVLQIEPDHAEAMNFLGYTYAIQSINLGKAEALIHRALILKPGNGYYLDSLAWVYYKNGDFSKAITTQEKALEITPDDAIMHEHYGDMLWRAGNKQAARQAWQKAIELKPDHIQAIKAKINNGLTASQ
ncbi:tetratricopeptide repeat protein [Mariprofundus ferrooxydans]|nr:tetratricopeptide repeat protein [Mariprofundus ferrooxydans]